MSKLYEAWGYKATLPQWADAFGIKHDTLYRRLQRGIDLETALTSGRWITENRPTYEYKGERHTSREWAEIIGVTQGTFRRRIRTMPPDRAFERKDLRLKGEAKKPTRTRGDDALVTILYSDNFEKPSVATIKPSEIDSYRKRYKYTILLPEGLKSGK